MFKKISCWLPGLLIAVVAFGFTAPASATLLGSDQAGNLFSINTSTGAGTLIGTETNFPLATEIEFDQASGILYSEESNGATGLHTINPATGLSTGFVTHGCCALNGMEFVGSTLYATNIQFGGGAAPSDLVTVNTATGAISVIGATGLGPISGLAFDGSTMFGVTAGGGPAQLVSMNLATGLATVLFNLIDSSTGALLDTMGSIEFGANGTLYGGIAQSGSVNPGGLYSINTANGQANFIGNTGFSVTGLTETSVPAPATLALFGLALAGLGWSRRKS